MRNVQRYDSLQLVAGAVIDTDGFMRDSPIVARTGVYEYRNPDGTIRREYRPADEVFASDALNSFRGKPITVLHPKKGKITAANAFGTAIGSILSDGYQKDDKYVACDIVIFAPDKMGKHRELSLGYRCDCEETPGVAPDGQPYDAIQRNIRINHLAVVPLARAGMKARLNCDGDEIIESEETQNMSKFKIDGVEHEVPEAVANYITALQSRADATETSLTATKETLAGVTASKTELQSKLDAMTSERDGVQGKLDAMTAERDSLKTKVDAAEADKKAAVDKAVEDTKKEVKERAELEADAKKAKCDKTDGMDNKALKIAIIKAVRGDSLNFDGKSDDYVNAYYDSIRGDIDSNPAGNQFRRTVINTDNDNKGGAVKTAAQHRQDMIDGMINKDKEEK